MYELGRMHVYVCSNVYTQLHNQSKETTRPSKDSNNLTKLKEEQHLRSFQNLLNVHPATCTDHTIHQSPNSTHAKDMSPSLLLWKRIPSVLNGVKNILETG